MEIISDYYFKIRNKFAFSLPVVYCFCDKRKYFLKFFIIGLINGAISLFLLFFLYDFLSLNLVFSTSTSFILSFLFSFIFQKYWTFRDSENKHNFKQVVSYSANIFLGLNINAFLMHLFVNRFNFWYLFSQIAVNVIISVYNFIVYKYIIFRKK